MKHRAAASPGGDLSRYTCFSGHQHQLDQIRAACAEEGSRTSRTLHAAIAAALASGVKAGETTECDAL